MFVTRPTSQEDRSWLNVLALLKTKMRTNCCGQKTEYERESEGRRGEKICTAAGANNTDKDKEDGDTELTALHVRDTAYIPRGQVLIEDRSKVERYDEDGRRWAEHGARWREGEKRRRHVL